MHPSSTLKMKLLLISANCTFGVDGYVLHCGTELVLIGVGLDRQDPSDSPSSSGIMLR
jgi:hypothetical protein